MTDLIERLRNYPMADAGGQMLTNEAADALEQNNEEIAERDAIIRILQSRLAKAEETKNIEQDAYDILAKQSEVEIARLREALDNLFWSADFYLAGNGGEEKLADAMNTARQALQEHTDDR